MLIALAVMDRVILLDRIRDIASIYQIGYDSMMSGYARMSISCIVGFDYTFFVYRHWLSAHCLPMVCLLYLPVTPVYMLTL